MLSAEAAGRKNPNGVASGFASDEGPRFGERPAVSSVDGATAGAASVMVVEDDPMLRRAARLFLERAGYRVREASTYSEACQSLSEAAGTVELVIVDYFLAGARTGVELVAELRQRRPGLKAILTSGVDEEVMRRRGVDWSDCPFLQKPFAGPKLLAWVRATLSDSPLPQMD